MYVAVAQDGMVTGSCGIDTGQSSTGNMLGWFVEHMAGLADTP